MKVLLVGQNLAYNPYTSITKSFFKAFQNLGDSVELYDLSLYYSYDTFSKIAKKYPQLELLRINNLAKDFYNKISANNYDLVLVIKGTFLKSKTVHLIKKHKETTKIVCFNPDDPLNYNKAASNKEIKNAIKYFDHYFIWSKKLVDEISKINKNVSFLSFAADREFVKIEDYKNLYEISFIGNGDKERSYWINSLSKYSDININVFGNGYNIGSHVTLNPAIYGPNYFVAMGRSKININILRKQNKGSTNMRTYEIPAMGKFMLHEYSEEAMEVFRPEKEAVYFKTPEELYDKCKYYLTHETERENIAMKAYNRTISKNLFYELRVEQIKKELGYG